LHDWEIISSLFPYHPERHILKTASKPISELHDKNDVDADVDVKQLIEEIEAEREKNIEEQFKNTEYREKVKQEAVEFYSQIPMYDFAPWR
jgi:hypothetical protein